MALPKGMDLMAMMGKASAKPAGPVEPSEDSYGSDSVREEADLAAKEFARNPTADTFRAVMQLCEELEAAEGYDDEDDEME